MVETKSSCLDLCHHLLISSGFDEDDFKITSYEKENEEITLETSNGNFDIIFKLLSIETFKRSRDDNEEDDVVHIQNMTVKGYYSPKFSQLDQKHLLSLFGNLAVHHCKLISKSNEETTCEQLDNAFQKEENQEMLENLYKLIENMDQKEIDLKILKQSIDQLIHRSKEELQPRNEKLCVNSSIFQKKILFKKDHGYNSECLLFNLQEGRLVSIVYDMLCLLYLLTDQEQRQKYFHEITHHYYEVLQDNLACLNVDLPLEAYERDIKTFIPYVKLELVCFYVKKLCEEVKKEKDILDIFNSNNDYRKLISELVSEIYDYILAPEINIEDCFKIVNDAIGTNYENLSYKLVKLDGILGLLGEYYKLKISVTQMGNIKVFHLFAKFVIKQYGMNMFPIFSREEFFYTTFLSELRKVGLEDITNFLPRCYFVRQSDVIIFEDLSYSNYRTLKCDELFSYEMLQLVVRQFAKMHACSLLYEEIMTKKLGKESRLSDNYQKYLEEMIYVKGNEIVDMVNNCGIDSTVNFVFDQFPDVPKEITMETFRERARKLFEVMIEKSKISEKYRNVICHGDIWGGNILFKFDGTEPSACCFIDYQLIRYNPPAHDLLAFLYINTDKETREKYMSRVIDQYYEELSSIFKKYDFDLKKIYPYNHYMDCCKFMKSQAICLAALTYSNSLDREKIQNIPLKKKIEFMTVSKAEVLQELMKDNRVKLRFREIVEDLYELCLDNNLE